MIKLAFIDYSEPLVLPFDSIEYIDSSSDDFITVNFRESNSTLDLACVSDGSIGRRVLIAFGEYQEQMSKAVSE